LGIAANVYERGHALGQSASAAYFAGVSVQPRRSWDFSRFFLSCVSLGLEEGKIASAVIKASSVMIAID
jgi:hypothetical protein